MGVFENLIYVNDKGEVASHIWIKWIHEGTKEANTNAEKQEKVLLGETTRHCAKCLNLNGCYFPLDNMPEQPLHPNCHCYKTIIDKPIAGQTAHSVCYVQKIRDYAFVKESKKKFFNSNGYDIIDSEYICKTIEDIALKKYISGNFKLGKLDEHGQRITIRVELPGRTRQGTPFTFHTGWMVYPDGKIVLTTPATELSKM